MSGSSDSSRIPGGTSLPFSLSSLLPLPSPLLFPLSLSSPSSSSSSSPNSFVCSGSVSSADSSAGSPPVISMLSCYSSSSYSASISLVDEKLTMIELTFGFLDASC
jgi:hypothetical protein